MDSDGYFWIVDRMDNGFVSDGMLIYRGDIERALSTQMPSNTMPSKTSAVAVPDAVEAAAVVPTAGAQVTEEGLLEACRDALSPPAGPSLDHICGIHFTQLSGKSATGQAQGDGGQQP